MNPNFCMPGIKPQVNIGCPQAGMIKSGMITVMEISAWTKEHVQKPPSQLRHPPVQIKALSCTEEYMSEHDPEMQRPPLG